LDLRHEFAYLFSGKSTKTAVNRAALLDSSMQGGEGTEEKGGREGRGKRNFVICHRKKKENSAPLRLYFRQKIVPR